MRVIQKSSFGFLIVGLLTVFSKSFACAGDYATRKIIGFSHDGNYFAFEQFGMQDGSGFPYSEIFIIDTTRDSWVTGTPVRVLLRDENQSINEAREQARSHARSQLDHLEIVEPGEHLASNPRAEVSADPHSVAVNLAYNFMPPGEEIVSFSLTEKTLTSDRCAKFTEVPVKGFKLTMRRQDEEPIIMQDDETLAKSRGCPQGYSVADVYRHKSEGAQTFVILLNMQSHGFEGPDSRFLAITHRLQ